MIGRLLDHLPVLFTAVVSIIILFIYLYRNIAIARKCPLCRETEIRRIERTGLLKKLPFAKKYFCANCNHRFILVDR